MLDLLTILNPTEIISAIFVTLGSVFAVWYRKKLVTLNKFWGEVFNGLRAVPELQKDVKGIIYFVSPNGGGSLMDSAKRTEAAVTQVADRLEILTQTVWAEHDTDEEVARFHCNSEGENTYINQTYARWVGVGKEELMGWGFINIIHPDDVVRVRAHWEQCRKEHRQYRMAHRMLKPDGSVFNVNVVATPIPENSPNVKRWVGYIRKARQEGE